MKIAANTDHYTDKKDVPQIISAMAEAGFTHLHWCHHWVDDYFYQKDELAEIRQILRDNSMTLMDVHGSHCPDNMCWYSQNEEERKRGVQLVRNRLEMMDYLEATGALMMHGPLQVIWPEKTRQEHNHISIAHADALRRTIDELMPELEKYNRPIALENLWGCTWGFFDMFFAAYPDKYLGLCYDSGHSNAKVAPGIDDFELRKKHLKALHLHDNDGEKDLHQPPFYGTIDWERLAQIIGTSGYTNPVSFELSIGNTPFLPKGSPVPTPEQFKAYLKDAYERCSRIAAMVEKYRNN